MFEPILTTYEEILKLKIEGSCKWVNPTVFKHLIGSLRYKNTTRPGITCTVGFITRFIETRYQSHVQASEHNNQTKEMKLIGLTDRDWLWDIEARKSTSRYMHFHNMHLILS